MTAVVAPAARTRLHCTGHECSPGAGGATAVGGHTGVGGDSTSGTFTTPRELSQDPRLVGDGTSNRTGWGGYWWTYVERSGRSQLDPYTGKIDPNDNMTFRPHWLDKLALVGH